MNGNSYTYGSKPHAVTAVGSTSYVYDAKGNMICRGTQVISWDVENRPVAISDIQGTTTFTYDGDGNRGKKTGSGDTVIYVNQYYEKNLTSGNVTTYYYLGDRLVALRNGTNLRYIHEDTLNSTSVVTDTSGSTVGSIKYYPYGSTRSSSGSLYTDKMFTGQRLDSTGLYYFGARYYDPTIGRFISPDSIIPNAASTQSFNRYSYCINNPLRYTDPTGHDGGEAAAAAAAVLVFVPGVGWVVIGVGVAAGVVVFGGYILSSALDYFDRLLSRWGPSPMEELAMSVWIEDHQCTTMPCPNINPPTYEEALEYYNWKMGQAGSTESVKIGDDLNTNVHFAKQDLSREAWAQHKQNLDSLRKELKDLERELERATGPKTRDPIKEQIAQKENQIAGEEKEMQQKWKENWENGPPEE